MMNTTFCQIYAQSVPYPHGAVFGEELFQTGVLPSDTDFRIFRDFGHLKGIRNFLIVRKFFPSSFTFSCFIFQVWI